MFDVVIIGKGPAGISAAIYAQRSGFKVLVVSHGVEALKETEWIENYYGFPEPLTGKELQERGEAQATRLGIELIQDEVMEIKAGEGFEVVTGARAIPCRSVVLATGKSRKKVAIEGFDALNGKGISYCAVCDGFFYRGKNVGVLGDGDYALHEAGHLRTFAKTVTLFTNGETPTWKQPPDLPVETRPIDSVQGQEKLEGLVLKDRTALPLDGLFVATGFASAQDLAQKVGVITEKGSIVIDKNGMTNYPGIFAAGDCTGGFLQIAKAVGEGAVAGQNAAAFVRRQLRNT